jgi:hypothetical protein
MMPSDKIKSITKRANPTTFGLVTPAIVIALMLLSPAPSFGHSRTRIKIDTVDNTYTPSTVNITEPVSMKDFYFEVNLKRFVHALLLSTPIQTSKCTEWMTTSEARSPPSPNSPG